MSCSYYVKVEGIKPKDEKFDAMLGAYHACKVAGVDPPTEVIDYFGGLDDDDNLRVSELGVLIHLGQTSVDSSSWRETGASCVEMVVVDDAYCTVKGMVIDLEQLPPDVKKLRILGTISC